MMILQQTRGNLSSGDQLALDLPFAATKSLTARVGPTPIFTRASGATYVGSDGLIHGVDTSTTSNSIGTGSKTFTLSAPAGQDQLWRTGDAVEATNGTNSMFGAVTSYDANTQVLVCNITSITGSGTFNSWRIGYRGPRFDHDPITGICRGLLIEESRTNLLLQSETLTTQTRTVTAVAHTLSFYGSGTVVLSGAHSATVVGTGDYPSRRTFTFTPTAGSLTLTVTGTVQLANLEAGSFPTSYIPTTTASVVRSADVCSITGAAFTGFWNNNEGSLFSSGDARTTATGVATYVMANSGANANQVSIYRNSTANIYGVANSGSYTANISASAANGSFNKIAGSYATNDARSAANGVLGTPDSTVTVPTNLTRLNIGSAVLTNSEFANGSIAAIRYFRKPLSNAKLQALTV